MKFDMQKARDICAHVCHPFAEVNDEDVGQAMEQFSRALSRIDELEAALIEERANQLVNGTEYCVVPDEALPDEECYCVDEPKECGGYDYLKKVAREQLQKEGLL